MTDRTITMITSGLGVGGSELQLVQLATGLHKLGWRVNVISMQAGGAYAKLLIAQGIPVTDVPVGRIANLSSLTRLRAHVTLAHADVIHTQAFRANLWGRLVGIIHGTPVIASVRATYRYVPRAYYPVERWLGRHSAAVITPSRATSQYLIDKIGVLGDRVVTIPNGVDTTQFSPSKATLAIRTKWNLVDRFVVLAPGRLVAYKNHAAVIEAFRRLVSTRHDALLIVAGSGPSESDLRRRASGLESAVRFVGELNREDMAEVMAASDVVCLASLFEGMSNVVLEAMAAGLPVVASAVDGIPEVVNDHQNGLLLGSSDSSHLLAAFQELAGSKMLRGQLGRSGRATVMDKHSIDQNVARHVEVYERSLTSSARSGNLS